MVRHQLVEERRDWDWALLLRRTGYQLLKRASARGHSTSRGRTQLLGAFTTGHLDKRTGPCHRTRGLGWRAALFSTLPRSAPKPLRGFPETQTLRRVSPARTPAGIRAHHAAFPPRTWPPQALQDSSWTCPPGREFSQTTQPRRRPGEGSGYRFTRDSAGDPDGTPRDWPVPG